jgi:tetratricopeptide (TPR) repeat protein
MNARFFAKYVILPLLVVSFLDIYPVPVWSLDKPAPQNLMITPEELLFKDGKYEEVIAAFSAKAGSINSLRYHLLGKSYSALNNSNMALKNFDLALLLNPKDAEAKALRGMELLIAGKDQEARVNFKEALEINPKNETAYLGIEKYYLKKKNKFELRSLYAEMIEKIGPKAEYYLLLCEVNIQSGIYDAAKQSCRKGIEIAQDKHPRLYVLLAKALKESSGIEEAKELYKKTADKFPKCLECQMEYAYFLDGLPIPNTIESEKYFKAATMANPSEGKSWIGLGNSRFENLKYQESLDAFRGACKLSSNAVGYIRSKQRKAMELKQEAWISKYEALGNECRNLFIEPIRAKK